ncbi:MAG: methanogenesis marker 6 protein [Methanoregulaceae archaeon]|jgi:putative methanogenesis marker protein 6|nr:methanogenesis marker 6 protein [Methanoregulaceae archaeon]
MSEYIPRYQGSVTKYIFVESPEMTPQDLAVRAYEISGGSMIKETCFGLQVTGTAEDVEKIIEALRLLDPDHIFVKDRGFPPGDPRRCRANLGGARPGFFGHEFEISLIRHVSHGLHKLPERDTQSISHPPSPGPEEKLNISKLKMLIDAQEP